MPFSKFTEVILCLLEDENKVTARLQGVRDTLE